MAHRAHHLEKAVHRGLAGSQARERKIRGLPPEDLQRRCETPGGTRLAVWKWLRSMVEHEIHHRGQIYLMLGMLGIPTPPLYGLTSEEVHARSILT
jgi:uncharacterized damage-inducible protein DinB